METGSRGKEPQNEFLAGSELLFRRYGLRIALLLGLLLALAGGGAAEAVNVAKLVQQRDAARAITASSTVVLTSGGNQPPANSATVSETTQEQDPIPTGTQPGQDGIQVNIVSVEDDFDVGDHYFEFTIQAAAADVPFPSGDLIVRFVTSDDVEREGTVVSSSGTVDPGQRAGATVRLPGTDDDHVTEVQVVFEEPLQVSGNTATVTRAILSVSGLPPP